MSTEAGKMWYLKQIDLFDKLSSEEMDKLADMTHVQDVPENQPIYFPGDTADTVFMLKKGRVRISRQSPDGDSITLALLEPGEVFGEMALADEGERTTRAETMTNAFICAASRDKFIEVVKQNPDLNLEITKMMGERRRKIETRINNLIFKDAKSRVAYILVDLFEEHAEDDQTGKKPKIGMTHEEIAKLSGLTRPTTTNILNDFQKDGLIDLGRGTVTLEDSRGLRKIAGD